MTEVPHHIIAYVVYDNNGARPFAVYPSYAEAERHRLAQSPAAVIRPVSFERVAAFANDAVS